MNLGVAGIVFGQATLGSNLILLKKEKTNVLSYSYIGSVILFKNLLMPLVSLGIIYLCWVLGVFGDNVVSAYIVFICFCSPTAFLLLLICQNLDYGVKICTWLMLGIYIFAIPTLIIFSYIFFIVI